MAEPIAPTYYATWGPRAGPIRYCDKPGAMGVVTDPNGSGLIVGQAYCWKWIDDPRGSLATFRLRINGEWLPGLFTCEDRRFMPVLEASHRS